MVSPNLSYRRIKDQIIFEKTFEKIKNNSNFLELKVRISKETGRYPPKLSRCVQCTGRCNDVLRTSIT